MMLVQTSKAIPFTTAKDVQILTATVIPTVTHHGPPPTALTYFQMTLLSGMIVILMAMAMNYREIILTAARLLGEIHGEMEHLVVLMRTKTVGLTQRMLNPMNLLSGPT